MGESSKKWFIHKQWTANKDKELEAKQNEARDKKWCTSKTLRVAL